MSLSSEDIYRCLMDKSADGYIVSDAKGLIVSCNKAVAKLVGKDEGQLVGSQLSSLIDFERDESKDASGAVSPLPAGADKHGIENVKTVAVIGKAGNEFLMPVTHTAIASGNGKSGDFLTIIYILQASTVQQAQTEFVSTVSHELRTPLTSIKGFADTILRAGDRIDVAAQRRYIGIIKDQADRLTRLVEDLLAVSRLESKRLQLTIRAIDLKEAVERVQRNLSEKAGDHSVDVRFGPGIPPVWADADRLEQILTNLIDNAIKYSPANTTVTVSANVITQDDPKQPEMIEICVNDQGVGISKENIPKIFSKFSRLDNPLVRQTEGTGLGLYITRSLVLALGGDISITSEPGNTTFTVKLPSASLEMQAARGRDI
ncbi:MAG: ATP-binding protein [Cyanobacteriota/Melainabacteria group bacterium]